jgi:hypothetical protein
LGGSILINEGANLALTTIVASLMVGLSLIWDRDPRAGVIMMPVVGIGLYLASLMPVATVLDIALFGALGLPPYIVTKRIAGPWLGAIAVALGGSAGWLAAIIVISRLPLWPTLPLSLVSIFLGLTLFLWRSVVLYPFLIAWNALTRRADERRPKKGFSLLRKHSAFWDEHQPLPLIGLPEHLLHVIEHNPAEGQAAIDYLTTSRQRWAAQAAQVEIEARWLESCQDVEAIGNSHHRLSAGELTGPASALLRSFSRLSQDVMAALQQTSAYNQRLALNAVEDRLDNLLRELTRSSERYALRFRPIAADWRQTIANHSHALAEMVESRQEIDNPYVIGVPLTEQQEIFVGRTDISARIEQFLLDRQRSPLLLYGQRRMGKTSLLNNLGRLLPSTIVPLFVDLQGPASRSKDYTGFLYNIARGMITSAWRQRNLTLPALDRDILAIDPFTYFDEWLDQVEAALGENRALLAFDEFEALDTPLAEGRFNEATLLGMVRNLIQHRLHLKILLTGSHTLNEFQRWASYLINVQTIHISYLNETEARQLIEQPVRGFALHYEPEASRQVLNLTHCHPFLVQLLCGEIVALKNEQAPAIRRLARLVDVEAAAPEALSRGSFFFADIERNQVNPAGLALLRFLAAQGEGAVVDLITLSRHFSHDLEQTLALLVRRELIEPVNGGYRFQVELIRRWFNQP